MHLDVRSYRQTPYYERDDKSEGAGISQQNNNSYVLAGEEISRHSGYNETIYTTRSFVMPS